jgi:hypothetical protein
MCWRTYYHYSAQYIYGQAIALLMKGQRQQQVALQFGVNGSKSIKAVGRQRNLGLVKDDPRKFIYPWVLKCSRSFLPIILKIFISGSFRISWLVVRFPLFWLKLKLSNDIFLKSCQHKHTIDQCYSNAWLKLPEIKILSMIGRNEREHFKTHG